MKHPIITVTVINILLIIAMPSMADEQINQEAIPPAFPTQAERVDTHIDRRGERVDNRIDRHGDRVQTRVNR